VNGYTIAGQPLTMTAANTIIRVGDGTATRSEYQPMKTVLAFGAALLMAFPASAQVEQVTTPPPNFVLSNYYSVPVGPFGGLEGAAYVARVGDPSAAWFNPAGLARQSSPQISGSAGVYQRTSLTTESLPNRGGSIQQLPNFVGFTFAPRARLTVGAAMVTTNAWNQETDSEAIFAVPGGQQRFAYSEGMLNSPSTPNLQLPTTNGSIAIW
jgi:hypothetical protein